MQNIQGMLMHACVPLEIIKSIISMKCGSTGKGSIHKLGQISNCYPKIVLLMLA